MKKKKIKPTDLEIRIKNLPLPKINYGYQKSVSYSQFSTFSKCQYQWYLTYVKNLTPFSDNIHTIFGSSIHKTLQEYITKMYGESGAAADRMDLDGMFQDEFTKLYSDLYEKNKKHFSTADEMREFYNDGVAILDWIKKKRNILFTLKDVKLLGIELPIIQNLKSNLFLKGYVDFALYDVKMDKVYIYDIKTSKSSWGDHQKKDETKVAQILLYKEYFAKQYDFPIDKIEVEFFIVKRKVWEQSEFPQPRVQHFKPASGKGKINQAVKNFEEFLNSCFGSDGKPLDKTYPKTVGEDSCRWCPYNNSPSNCDKIS